MLTNFWSTCSILGAICGYRKDAVDPDRLPLYLQYTPAGTSVQNIAHWVRSTHSHLTQQQQQQQQR
jgi:hypothetical protein